MTLQTFGQVLKLSEQTTSVEILTRSIRRQHMKVVGNFSCESF
jgi:hypothetical protein